MKKLVLISVLALFTLAGLAQKNIISTITPTDSVKGTSTLNVDIPDKFQGGEWDLSFQIIPTQAQGDSLNTAIAFFQSNSLAGTSWTEVTAERDTITTTAGSILEVSNFLGARARLQMKGISTDTITYKIYYVFKKPINE